MDMAWGYRLTAVAGTIFTAPSSFFQFLFCNFFRIFYCGWSYYLILGVGGFCFAYKIDGNTIWLARIKHDRRFLVIFGA